MTHQDPLLLCSNLPVQPLVFTTSSPLLLAHQLAHLFSRVSQLELLASIQIVYYNLH